jgi:hypothetical protein
MRKKLIDEEILYSIEKSLNLPQFLSKGHRNALIQQAILTILSSVVGLSHMDTTKFLMMRV